MSNIKVLPVAQAVTRKSTSKSKASKLNLPLRGEYRTPCAVMKWGS